MEASKQWNVMAQAQSREEHHEQQQCMRKTPRSHEQTGKYQINMI